MKTVFTNPDKLQCIFTDDGVTFCGATQDAYMPYGCIDSISLSLMGILQATSRSQICTFTIDRKDRGEVKEMIRFAKEAMKTAPKAEFQLLDKAQSGLSPEEQLKQLKQQFIQGAISKEEYDARKRLLKN